MNKIHEARGNAVVRCTRKLVWKVEQSQVRLDCSFSYTSTFITLTNNNKTITTAIIVPTVIYNCGKFNLNKKKNCLNELSFYLFFKFEGHEAFFFHDSVFCERNYFFSRVKDMTLARVDFKRRLDTCNPRGLNIVVSW